MWCTSLPRSLDDAHWSRCYGRHRERAPRPPLAAPPGRAIRADASALGLRAHPMADLHVARRAGPHRDTRARGAASAAPASPLSFPRPPFTSRLSKRRLRPGPRCWDPPGSGPHPLPHQRSRAGKRMAVTGVWRDGKRVIPAMFVCWRIGQSCTAGASSPALIGGGAPLHCPRTTQPGCHCPATAAQTSRPRQQNPGPNLAAREGPAPRLTPSRPAPALAGELTLQLVVIGPALIGNRSSEIGQLQNRNLFSASAAGRLGGCGVINLLRERKARADPGGAALGRLQQLVVNWAERGGFATATQPPRQTAPS